MKVLDDFGERLISILEDLEGIDLRETHRRHSLRKVCSKAYPTEHDITIIGIVDELYIKIFSYEK